MFTAPHRQLAKWLLLGLLLTPLAGCVMLADVVSPDFVQGLGLDPATLSRPTGVVMVAFVNNSNAPAQFYAYYTANLTDWSVDSRNFSLTVDAGGVGNEVIECPVAVVGPGMITDVTSFATNPLAVTVADADGEGNTTDISYTGPAPQAGTSFECGDVIEITLRADLVVTVRVVPGR